MADDGATLPLLKGTLDLLVLTVLDGGPNHGYGIVTWLEERSDGALGVEDSAVYQALRRLEDRGLVRAEWGVTENNRRARYYEPTPEGARHLRRERAVWRRYTRAVSHLLDLAGEPS